MTDAFHFDFGFQPQLSGIPVLAGGKRHHRLTDTPGLGVSGIEASADVDPSVFGKQRQPEYARNTGDAVVDHTKNQVRPAVAAFGHPDPGRTDAETEAGGQVVEPLGMLAIIAVQIAGIDVMPVPE